MRYSILYAKIMIYNYGVVCAFFAAANSIPSLFRYMNPRNGGIAMKSTVKQTHRSLMSILLALCMLVSCITVGLVPTDAAQVDIDSSVGWSDGTFKISDSITGKWDSSATNTMSGSGQYRTFDYYLTYNSDYKVYIRFYSESDSKSIGAQEGNDTPIDTTEKQTNDNSNSFLFNRSWLPNDGSFYKVTITFDRNAWSGSGGAKYSTTQLTNLDPSFSVSATTVNAGNSVTISNPAHNGTAAGSSANISYSYEYSTNQTTWNNITGTTFTPSSAGTYYLRAKATDNNVVNGTNSTDSRSYYSSSANYKTITVNPSYSVSVVSENTNMGTVASGTVTAGSTAVTIPAATPKYGYKFKQWVATSPASIASGATSSTGGKVTATGTGGRVTAQFEPDPNMNLYIAGRFHVRIGTTGNNWNNSFDSNNWSDTGDENIKFTYVSGTTYKVETNASVSELSHTIGSADPYFFVYDADARNGWHPVANASLNGTTTSASLSTNTSTYNARFEDSDNNDTPVTLFFDTATKTLSYSVPTYYTVTCNPATGGSVTASPAREKAGETVTLTISPNTGYQLSSISASYGSGSSVSLSGTGNTRTFTMPSGNVTVTPTFSKISYSLTKASTSNGSFTLNPSSSAQYGNTVTVTCSPNSGYEVDTVTYKQTGSSGTGTTVTGNSNTRTFSMPAYNTTVTVTFKETLHTITVETNSTTMGTVLRGSTTVSGSTTKIGNITNVTLVATNQSGYEFDHWTVTKGSSGTATTAIVNGTSISLTASETTVTGASASSTFRFNGTATVKAYFKASDYSLNAVFTHNSEATWNGNTVTTTDTDGNAKGSLHINDFFEVKVTLAAGYEVNGNPTFETGTGFVSATLQSGYPTVNGSIVVYRYKAASAGKITAKVTLKAVTPTISNVQIKNTGFSFAAPGNPTENYYLQPTEVKATTQSFATLGYNNTRENQTGKSSGVAVTLTQPTITLNAEDATADYTLTITATNSPDGVAAANTSQNYTIKVKFNDAQKAYFRLNKLLERCISIASADRSYFNDGAPIDSYNSAFTTATNYINDGWPDYNASAEDATNAEAKYNAFNTAYTNLMNAAKTTTVYVLTNYADSAANPINVTFSQNNSYTSGFNILKMYNYGKTINASNETRHTTYEGKVTYSGDRYFYTITYAGRGNIRFWRGASSTDASLTSGEQLTGSITGATGFKDYYVNIYATSAGSGATSTAISEYSDFDHSINTGKKFLELGDVKTGSDIKTLFNITPTGSIVSDPGIDNLTTTNNTAFTIEGPVDKGLHAITNLKTTSFKAEKQGRYIVKYTTKFGKNASGNDITRTKEMTLYVAFDEVSVYVDMNDNIGTPILNFKYWQNNQTQTPVESTESGATEAYLPYEMELVTGSESIYKCTIKTSDLHKTYFLKFDADHPLTISYITVERVNYSGAGGAGFDILSEARITGEIWLKADSTNLTTFKTISCGSVTKTFVAALDNGEENKSIIPEAVELLHGTGINTDVNEVYKSQYAGLYTLKNASAHMNDFHYVLNTSVKYEASLDNDTVYFDKWLVCPSANVSYPKDAMTDELMVSYPGSSEVAGTATAMNFTSAQEYGDGDNDVTYIAVYKLVSSNKPVRVETTYKFKDYDTSDGNYVFDETRDVVDASYTKTITTDSTSMSDVRSSLESIAQNNAPFIRSNYFDYSFKTNSLTIVSEKANESKFVITVELTHTPHPYRIILKKGDTIVSNTTGYYQQTKNLSSGGCANPVWKDSSGNILGSGTTDSTFAARYVSSGNERDDNDADCQVIKVENGTSTAANNKSVVSNAYTEVYYTDNGTEMLRHNFYIIDYCAVGKLVGGGVLFATTDANGNYRQQNAGTHLADSTTRTNYIQSIINPVDPNNAQQRLDYFDVEFEAQTVNNVGFRYKPFKSTEDVYRYSDDLNAYITIFEGTNVNSSNYEGQKLRLFSFMVYDNNGTKVIVPSNGYAQVERYQPQSH